MLDLAGTGCLPESQLTSCISTPLVADDELMGVLTLYSNEPNCFNKFHARIVEVMAREIASFQARDRTAKPS